MTEYIIPPKSMSHFQPSKFVENIYYADLFKFPNTVWMISGCGKSKAAQIYINNNKNDDLGRDTIAIKSENNELFGRRDPGAINSNNECAEQFHKIDYFAHCLTEDQSKSLGYLSADELYIKEVSNLELLKYLAIYEYPGFRIDYFFSEEKCISLRDSKRRYNQFLKITNESPNTKFVLVPWAKSEEEKSKLYKNFLKT